MSIETTRPAPAGAPGALPRAESAATYNDKVVRQFTVATVLWGIVGMGVGVVIAAQLYWRSEEHMSALQSIIRISYALCCVTKKKKSNINYDLRVNYTT